jgi:hypothetical protein
MKRSRNHDCQARNMMQANPDLKHTPKIDYLLISNHRLEKFIQK